MTRIKSMALLIFVLVLSQAAISQKSNTSTVKLDATVESALTISVNNAQVVWSTGTGNPLRPGQPANPGSAGVTVTTNWVTNPRIAAVQLYAYFNTSDALSSSGGFSIPAAQFQISTNAGPMRGVNEAIPGYGAAALELQKQVITDTNRTGTMTSDLTFNIDLSSLPQLPADSYTGSLILQAEATI